jgi:hypothetical protein
MFPVEVSCIVASFPNIVDPVDAAVVPVVILLSPPPSPSVLDLIALFVIKSLLFSPIWKDNPLDEF